MRLAVVLRRFLLLSPLVSLICFVKYRAHVSPRAEVELGPQLVLGPGVRVSSFTKIKVSGPLIIGANAQIATGCFIGADSGGLEIGEDTLIGPNCTLVTGNYTYDKLDIPMRLQEYSSKSTRIGHNVLIGAGSVILAGSSVGDGVIIGVNSVVSGTIPDNVVIEGNPAKVIFKRR
ncbi:MAG: acyltransferase [Gammaproteobacteria bacterium]